MCIFTGNFSSNKENDNVVLFEIYPTLIASYWNSWQYQRLGIRNVGYPMFISLKVTLLALWVNSQNFYCCFSHSFQPCWPVASFDKSWNAHNYLAFSLFTLQSYPSTLIHGFLSSHCLILEKQWTEPIWRYTSSTYGFIFQVLQWAHATVLQSNYYMMQFLGRPIVTCVKTGIYFLNLYWC